MNKPKDTIVIENEQVDPYYILGISKEDSIDVIEFVFKKKAKLLHPDKSKIKDPKFREKTFRFLRESYNYVKSQKIGQNMRERDSVTEIPMREDINSSNFNEIFEKSRQKRPEDIGYETKRMQTIEEYEAFDYKPADIFNGGRFDNQMFNQIFNSTRQQNEHSGLVQKTNDGFYGINSGFASGAAPVKSYNGMMITGDVYSQDGFNSGNYGDYKQMFEGTLNPTQETLSEFKEKSNNVYEEINDYDTPLSAEEFKKRVKQRQQENQKMSLDHYNKKPSKAEFKKQMQEIEQKNIERMLLENENNKKYVTEYAHMYRDHNQLLRQAERGQLEGTGDKMPKHLG